jgi:Predicted GTPases
MIGGLFMPKFNKVKKCSHCGEILQSEDPTRPGYIDKETMERYPDGVLLCNNCYSIEKSKTPQEAMLDEDFDKILDQIRSHKCLVVYVVDLFSFEGSFISRVNEMLQGCDVLAIGNKRDLLPSNIDDKELLEYVSHRLRVAHLAVKDVVLTSSTTGYNIDLMYEKIKKLSSNKDVYFVGSTVSGKSALIAEFLKKYKNNTQELIITYNFPGTSLRGFKIPMGQNTYIYETPGLSINNSMLSQVELLVGHAIIPNETIHARSYKLGLGMSLLFGGLALVELLKGEETKIDVYAKFSVDLKVTKNGEAHFGSALTRHTLKPCSNKLRSFADFDVYDLEITEIGDRDLGILGLGWFHFIGNGQVYRVFVPKGVYVYTTRSKIKNA